MKIPCFLLLLLRVRSQEVSTPSSLLRPRNHNHHPFDAQQFLKSLKAEPTKQGPVLFPNDAPPPPRPPLVVTARPLSESIARSELGAVNNTVASQSQVNGRVSFLPYLARVNNYRPFVPSPTFDYNFTPTQVPYADVVKKSRLAAVERDNRYNDYEEQTILPPIYKALSDHAEQKVLKLNQKQRIFNYQSPQPDFTRNYQNNDIIEENSEYDQNQNYAFSYRVNDHKTGDDFSHSQQSKGSATNGEYRVRLPDGRMQIVSYTADERGYKADVRYDDDNNDNYARNAGIDNQVKVNNDYVNRNTGFNNQVNINNDYLNRNTAFDNQGNVNNDYVNRNTGFDNQGNVNNDYVNRNKGFDNQVNVNNDYVNRNKGFDNQVNVNDDYLRNTGIDNQANVNNDYVDKYKVFGSNIYNNNYVGRKYVDGNNLDGVNSIYTVKNNLDYTDRSENDYLDTKKDIKDYHYPDVSKEYDYSSEYNSNYEPHKSKFSSFNVGSTVKPSYEELKDLLVTKNAYNTQHNYDPVELKVPSTTPIPFQGTTEHVVLIGNKTPNLYTNIKNSIGPSYSPRVVLATTPRSYLVSTIASLKNKVHLATPVLSEGFIDKINKYLSFN